MAFFRNEPITDVVRRLSLDADGEAGMNLLARSAWEPSRWNGFSSDRYKAKEVAELYHSRWEIEVRFRNLKSSLLNNALVLRMTCWNRGCGACCWLTT